MYRFELCADVVHFNAMGQTGLKSSLTIRWQLLPFGYRAQYDFQAPILPTKVQRALELVIREILPEECRSRQAITDIRGRDLSRPMLIEGSLLPRPVGEEILLVIGEQKVVPEDTESGEDPFYSTFQASITSKFLEFEGARHIKHSLHQTLDGSPDTAINFLDIALNPEIKVQGFRLGLEYFEASFLTLLGFAPSVRQIIQIECTHQQFAVSFITEGLPSSRIQPLSKRMLFSRLKKVLDELYNFDLQKDYDDRLR